MKNIASIATQVMPPPIHEDRVWKQEGNTGDIVEAILSAEQWNQDQTAALAQHLKGGSPRETLRNVWFFVRNYIKYRKDLPGYERVKLPSKTWADREGDCKSMSVFIAGLLKNLDIPAKYRFVSYRKGEPVSHVYVVAMPKGERQVIMDAVHSKFDDEVPYKSKKEYPVMTKIAVVHGLSAASQDDIPRKKTPWMNINWGKMTEGEMSLALIIHQAEMKKNWYGDPTGQLGASIAAMENAMYHGIHRMGSINAANILPSAAKAIARAKMQTRPAGTSFASTRDPFRQGLVPDMIGMPDEEFDKYFKEYLGKGICVPGHVTYDPEVTQFGKVIRRYRGPGLTALNANKELTEHQRTLLLQACYEQGKIIKLYNEKLPKSSHHILYNFIKSPNSTTSTVAKKTSDHQISRALLGETIAGLTLQNMDLFLRNGVMQANMDNGEGKLGPMEPEETIKVLIDGYLDGINAAMTIGAIVILVSKIIAAAGAAAALLRSLLPPKDQVAMNTIQGFSTAGFGPDESDWDGYSPQIEAGKDGQPKIKNDPTVATAGMSWLLPVLLGGGLIISSKYMK